MTKVSEDSPREKAVPGSARRLILTAAAAVLILAGSGARGQEASQGAMSGTPAGNAENGRRLFVVRDGCYQCHGTVGQGGAGARLAPRPLALAAFVAYVRKPTGRMMPYSSNVLSDAELADIRAYLATMPEPPPVKNIPLLNQ